VRNKWGKKILGRQPQTSFIFHMSSTRSTKWHLIPQNNFMIYTIKHTSQWHISQLHICIHSPPHFREVALSNQNNRAFFLFSFFLQKSNRHFDFSAKHMVSARIDIKPSCLLAADYGISKSLCNKNMKRTSFVVVCDLHMIKLYSWIIQALWDVYAPSKQKLE